MKKLIAFFITILIFACAHQNYNSEIFKIESGIKLETLEATPFVQPDGSMIVNISGLSNKNQVVYYKVEWYDEFDMPIKSIRSNWERGPIIKNLPFSWKSISTSPKAKKFKILIYKHIGSGTYY